MLDQILGHEPEKVIKKEVKAVDAFRVLSDKEHVLMRPGMYVGSTSLETHETCLFGQWQEVEFVAGLVKCANELIDNSVDEAIRTKFAFANKISVSVDGNKFIIEDNGRGIPQDNVQCPDGRIVLRPEAAWTMTKAGSNFNDERTTIGMNGVGSALANFFSAVFIGETGNGKSTVIVNCTQNADNVNVATKRGKWQGTKVTFIPDFTHFGCDKVDANTVSILEDRVRALAVAYPEIEFKFNSTKVSNKFKSYAKLYAEDYITIEEDNMSMMFTTTDSGWKQNSFVNGVQTKVGGNHVNMIFERLADEIIPRVKRKYKVEINRARVKECTTMVLFLRNFVNPKFDSQTKERLTNTYGEITKHIGDEIDYSKLANKIVGTEALIMPIIEAALARKLAAEKAAATKAAKAAKKTRVAKHVKANGLGNPTVKTTLFLTEGDSAIGYLLKVRDTNTQGGFPLRGKVLNTWNLGPADVMKNKELFEIMSILNLTIGEEPTDMTYDYVAIMTDADVDGTGSIYPLLVAFFYKHWPSLLEQGKILFAKTPQMISQGPNKQMVWSYDEAEFSAQKFTGKWEHRYIKGLGSLEEAEYKRVVREPRFDVIQVDDKSTSLMEMLCGDDSAPRKVWMS